MINLDAKPVKNEDLAWRMIDDEAILVDIDGEEVAHLNEVAAQIWDVLDGEKSVADIIEHIRSKFEVGRDKARKDVLAFLNKLIKREMVSMK